MDRSFSLSCANGWLILDKPSGMTSTRACTEALKILGLRKSIKPGKQGTVKVGHVGTLDPLASGVLPLALGEATKLIPYGDFDRKVYRFRLRFGEKRTTDDVLGEIFATSLHRPSLAEIEQALPLFQGSLWQKPPIFSAIHVKGERAYDLARKGVEVDLPLREIKIYSLELTDAPSLDEVDLTVSCSAGTYVRSLARDLGESLGTYGTISKLRRLAVGKFLENQAICLEKLLEKNTQMDHKLKSDFLLPIGAVLDDIPAVPISKTEEAQVRQGRPIVCVGVSPASSTKSVGVWSEGSLVALGRLEEGRFWPQRVLSCGPTD